MPGHLRDPDIYRARTFTGPGHLEGPVIYGADIYGARAFYGSR
ncbi:MAG TPA: hypothetical protein VEJ84_01235 [Acidimicrobiales bacterium]|nr:hypothetical protein [Acidimicrobiales bacterium]